jgi:hypothetical protein
MGGRGASSGGSGNTLQRDGQTFQRRTAGRGAGYFDIPHESIRAGDQISLGGGALGKVTSNAVVSHTAMGDVSRITYTDGSGRSNSINYGKGTGRTGGSEYVKKPSKRRS